MSFFLHLSVKHLFLVEQLYIVQFYRSSIFVISLATSFTIFLMWCLGCFFLVHFFQTSFFLSLLAAIRNRRFCILIDELFNYLERAYSISHYPSHSLVGNQTPSFLQSSLFCSCKLRMTNPFHNAFQPVVLFSSVFLLCNSFAFLRTLHVTPLFSHFFVFCS